VTPQNIFASTTLLVMGRVSDSQYTNKHNLMIDDAVAAISLPSPRKKWGLPSDSSLHCSEVGARSLRVTKPTFDAASLMLSRQTRLFLVSSSCDLM